MDKERIERNEGEGAEARAHACVCDSAWIEIQTLKMKNITINLVLKLNSFLNIKIPIFPSTRICWVYFKQIL